MRKSDFFLVRNEAIWDRLRSYILKRFSQAWNAKPRHFEDPKRYPCLTTWLISADVPDMLQYFVYVGDAERLLAAYVEDAER